MITTSHLQRMASPEIYDPAQGASQAAYREIAGEVPSTGERVTLKNWVCVFKQDVAAQAHYQLMADLLAQVDGSGQAIIRIADIPSDWLGHMSERTDLIGDKATIWVTSTRNSGDARGGILVGLNSETIHVLGVAPYVASLGDRAVYILERVAITMSKRLLSLQLAPANDTMSRLPILSDVAESLDNASVGRNDYRGNR